MNYLNPKEKFPLIWINKEWDGVKYYPQAKVYDAIDNEVLETINLEQDTEDSDKFLKDWYAPSDPAGQGRHIYIKLQVYSDANHTTKANFRDEVEHFLIQTRWNERFGTGKGDFIPPNMIRKIVKEEVEDIVKNSIKEIVKQIPKPELKKEIKSEIKPIVKIVEKAQDKKIDFSEVMNGLSALSRVIDKKFDDKVVEINKALLMKLDKKDFGLLINALEDIRKVSLDMPKKFDSIQTLIPKEIKKKSKFRFNV